MLAFRRAEATPQAAVCGRQIRTAACESRIAGCRLAPERHRHAPELEPRAIVKRRRDIRLDLRAINAGIVGAVQVGDGPLPSALVQARVLPADPAGLAAIRCQVDLREDSANWILTSNDDLGLVGWEQQVFALVHH